MISKILLTCRSSSTILDCGLHIDWALLVTVSQVADYSQTTAWTTLPTLVCNTRSMRHMDICLTEKKKKKNYTKQKNYCFVIQNVRKIVANGFIIRGRYAQVLVL